MFSVKKTSWSNKGVNLSFIHSFIHSFIQEQTAKHCDYRLEKQTITLRSVPQMLKKWRIVVNRISKVRQTTWSWTKTILVKATWMLVFNILILLFVFIMFNKLTCKVRFHIAVWSLSKSIRASSFIENLPQINAKLIAFQRKSAREASTKIGLSLPIVFQRNWPWKLPRNLTFFSVTYQKPCLINMKHSRK